MRLLIAFLLASFVTTGFPKPTATAFMPQKLQEYKQPVSNDYSYGKHVSEENEYGEH